MGKVQQINSLPQLQVAWFSRHCPQRNGGNHHQRPVTRPLCSNSATHQPAIGLFAVSKLVLLLWRGLLPLWGMSVATLARQGLWLPPVQCESRLPFVNTQQNFIAPFGVQCVNFVFWLGCALQGLCHAPQPATRVAGEKLLVLQLLMQLYAPWLACLWGSHCRLHCSVRSCCRNCTLAFRLLCL